LPQRGLVRQEEIPLKAFLANRFGQVYAMPEPKETLMKEVYTERS
jgi:hypothetical protein